MPSTLDGDWVKAFIFLDVEREPGTHFAYNTAVTYMLAAILHKVIGPSLVGYLTPRLFEPLGKTGATALKFDSESCHITLTLPSGRADVSD